MNLKLEFPEIKHKKEYLKMIKEWWKMEDLSSMSPWRLFEWATFEDFLNKIKKDKTDAEFVNAHLFLLVNENDEILWWIQIRHHINHPNLIENWWHIWYWIAPKFRKRWYATQMLELAIIEAKKLWIEKVLITCYLDNIWSNKIILRNWGIFERKSRDWLDNRYWIEI